MNKFLKCVLLLILLGEAAKANIMYIRYYKPEATHVTMVWGINDWQVADEKPEGTVIKNGVMQSPMIREGNYFVLKISVPGKAVVDYAFNYGAVKGPFKLYAEYWDCNNQPEKKFYHTNSLNNSTVKIIPDLRYIKPAREVPFLHYATFWFFTFTFTSLLLLLFKKLLIKKSSGSHNYVNIFTSITITFLVSLILIRCVVAELTATVLVSPKHSLPLLLKTSYYDFVYVLVLSLLFSLFFFTIKKKQKLILCLFALTAFLSLLVALFNIQIIKVLGRPFTYQWLYYSDFLKSTDSTNAVSANLDKSFIVGVLLIIFSTIPAAICIYQLLTRKTFLLFGLTCIICSGLAFFTEDDISIPYIKRANPITFFAASINPLARSSVFNSNSKTKSEFVEKNKNISRPEYASRFNQSKIKNVIIVVLESTPAEYVTAFDPQIKATPFLDSIKQSSVLFDAIYSHAPATNKSMFSILCGNYPYLSYKTITAERPDIELPSIPSELKKYGYRSSFFNSGDNRFQGAENFLKYRGFDDIQDFRNNTCTTSKFSNKKDSAKNLDGTDDACLSKKCLNWIDRANGQPFFSMLWTFQTHYPYYSTGNEIDFNVNNVILNKYLNALHHSDEMVRELYDGLKKKNLLESTLIVVLGDHGEAFGRHGQTTHALALYEENLHIPVMFINQTLFKSEHINNTGGISDIAPSIFSVISKPAPNEWQGENLFGVNRRKRVYFFTPWSDYLFGYREGDYKYIYNATTNSSELYYLKSDRSEATNIAEKNPEFVKQAYNNLMAWMHYQDNFMKPLVGK